ncbi:MAG: NAD(P)H-binding protein [Pseudomonadota bacterium]
MKLAVIGATGNIGSRVVREALQRDHSVTALARHPEKKLVSHPGLTLCAADLMDLGQMTRAIAGHDAVISTFNVGHDPAAHPNHYRGIMEGTRLIIAAVKQTGIKRFLFVGGAGSLYIAPGIQLADDLNVMRKMLDSAPPEMKAWAMSATNMPLSSADDYDRFMELHLDIVPAAFRMAFLLFEHDTSFNWTFLSPPAGLMPGERTGRYQICGEELPMEGDVPAGISMEDLSVAIVDEMENPKLTRRHWSVKALNS